jgi:hypothetical protein
VVAGTVSAAGVAIFTVAFRVFFGVAFVAAAASCALWKAAHRFLVAALILALPATENLRFGFTAGAAASLFLFCKRPISFVLLD